MSLYDIRQNQRISKAQTENKRTARTVQESQESIEELRQSVQKLSLACQAMWQLLQTNSGLSEQDLLEALQNIEDKNAAQNCAKCGRVQQSKKPNCLYCGTPFPEEASTMSCFQV